MKNAADPARNRSTNADVNQAADVNQGADGNQGADENKDGNVSVAERFSFAKRVWRAAPRSVRRSIVLLIGSTLLLLGAALVVLPGPFTLPLVLAGLAVLATEFAWAERLLTSGRTRMSRATAMVRRRLRR